MALGQVQPLRLFWSQRARSPTNSLRSLIVLPGALESRAFKGGAPAGAGSGPPGLAQALGRLPQARGCHGRPVIGDSPLTRLGLWVPR